MVLGYNSAGPMASLMAELYVTDTIKSTPLLERMKNGNLQGEYRRQWIDYLKRKGLYVEPVKKDSIGSKIDKFKIKKRFNKTKT